MRWVLGERDALDKIDMDADARHVPILAQQLGFESKSRSVASPGIRSVEPRGDKLDETRRASFRSEATRQAYLSSRPTRVGTCNEGYCTCSMHAPDEASWMSLNWTVRFCTGTRRVVQRFETQAPLSYVDGCTRAAPLMAGHHLLTFSSTTHTVVALSSTRSRRPRQWSWVHRKWRETCGGRTETKNPVRSNSWGGHRESSRGWPCLALAHSC